MMCMSGIAGPLLNFGTLWSRGWSSGSCPGAWSQQWRSRISSGTYNWSVCFFTRLWVKDLGENEILTEVWILTDGANTNSSFLKFPQPTSCYPYVGCAVAMCNSGWSCVEIRLGFSVVIPWLRSRWISIPWQRRRSLKQRISSERILDWCGISKSCWRL